jgi:hypothetical protein
VEGAVIEIVPWGPKAKNYGPAKGGFTKLVLQAVDGIGVGDGSAGGDGGAGDSSSQKKAKESDSVLEVTKAATKQEGGVKLEIKLTAPGGGKFTDTQGASAEGASPKKNSASSFVRKIAEKGYSEVVGKLVRNNGEADDAPEPIQFFFQVDVKVRLFLEY